MGGLGNGMGGGGGMGGGLAGGLGGGLGGNNMAGLGNGMGGSLGGGGLGGPGLNRPGGGLGGMGRGAGAMGGAGGMGGGLGGGLGGLGDAMGSLSLGGSIGKGVGNGAEFGSARPQAAASELPSSAAQAPADSRTAVVGGTPVEGQPDWAAYSAPDGRSYFYNATTGVSSWEAPQKAATSAPAPAALPAVDISAGGPAAALAVANDE
jgi:hypothetical protein